MKKYKTAIIIALVIVAVGVLIAVYRQGPSTSGNDSNKGLVGKSAPAFALKDRTGRDFSLESLKGKKVVLFFNEGIMCYPGCWNQIAGFGKDPRFNSTDTIALSVVVDPAENWNYAIQRMPDLSKATILIDSNKAVSSAYGMLTMTSSMHFGSLPGHTYVIIDREGVIRYVYDDPSMSLNNDNIFSELQKIN